MAGILLLAFSDTESGQGQEVPIPRTVAGIDIRELFAQSFGQVEFETFAPSEGGTTYFLSSSENRFRWEIHVRICEDNANAQNSFNISHAADTTDGP